MYLLFRFNVGRLPSLPLFVTLQGLLGLPSYIADYGTQNPAVHEEECQRSKPEARQEGALPEKLQLITLLQPQRLSGNPQSQSSDAQTLVLEERRPREVQGKQDHVPEEVLAPGGF